jgi:hypothetical protein
MSRYATFVVISKARGWWIVQRDPEGRGNLIVDQTKSGWVPAGTSLYFHISLAPSLIVSPPLHLLSSIHHVFPR